MLHAGGEDFIRIGNVTSSQRWARPPPNLIDVGKYKETRLTYNCAHLRSTKEKKEENIWRRKIFFAEGTINGGGKGG